MNVADKTQKELGRKGGRKTAERGPDYFRQIAAMRKTRAEDAPRNNLSPINRESWGAQ